MKLLKILVMMLLVTVLWSACSDRKELQITIKEKRARHDRQKRDVQRRLKAIEEGRPLEQEMGSGGGGVGFRIVTCVCSYRRGTSRPVSCSDPRCSSTKSK
jgi:hypothetical protein